MNTILEKIKGFIPTTQAMVLNELMDRDKNPEASFFSGRLASIMQTISEMPQTYETDGMGDEAIAYLHYFSSGCDWYITEKDMEVEQLQAFGLARLNMNSPELGYISIDELISISTVEIDLHFTPISIGKLKEQMT